MSIHVRLMQHGASGSKVGVRVEADDEYGTTICMYVEPETDDDKGAQRTLESHEARELAAVLVHYATEAERKRR